MSPNFELIAAILGDYHDLQADGIVEAANRFPLGAVEEQIQLLSQLEAAGNATLANRIAELEREVSMHRNAEITWEKTMMQAVGEDGPKSVVEAFDKIKAERDAFADRLEDAENQYSELHNINSALAAQVSRMSTFIKLSAAKWENCHEVYPTFWNLLRVASESPQQHLAEIMAQAGRDGFFKGVAWILDIDVKDISAMVAEEAAKQYADSIRKGE